MNFYPDDTITDFFNVSIVLPFYKKLEEFKRVLPRNLQYLERNGIELVIVLDTPDEEDKLITFLDEFPFLNTRVIINRQPHEWRNPSKAINVGIKHARYQYILIASPETEFLTDLIYQLRYVLHYYPDSYAVGQVCFLSFEETTPVPAEIHRYPLMPYGSIMVHRQYLEAAGAYAEEITKWGGDDDNIRARLDLLGLKKRVVTQAIGIHREFEPGGHLRRYKRNAGMPVETYRRIFYPHEVAVNKNDWGTDFNETSYHWQYRKSKQAQCRKYLDRFQQYWIKDDAVFHSAYRVIALIQVKNESKHLPEVLLHLDHYCDGIILLDDSSTDGSYEAAMSQKLLMKVQKGASDIFDDLGLRNITLDMAAFLDCEWLFFFDADERFDPRYADLYSIAGDARAESVCFSVVHLWNDARYYRRDVPERPDGILPRFRMFRAYGRLQIQANRLLHFPAAPFKHKRMDAPILVLHHGNINPEVRKMKYQRYVQQDKDAQTQGYTYDYLLEDGKDLALVDTLVLPHARIFY